MIKQGDTSEPMFSIIGTGTFDVHKGKKGESAGDETSKPRVKQYVTGDYFGEIGLMNDELPRQASVVCTSDKALLWVLSKSDCAPRRTPAARAPAPPPTPSPLSLIHI